MSLNRSGPILCPPRQTRPQPDHGAEEKEYGCRDPRAHFEPVGKPIADQLWGRQKPHRRRQQNDRPESPPLGATEDPRRARSGLALRHRGIVQS